MTVSVALSTDFPGFKVSHSSQPVSRNSRELFGPENYFRCTIFSNSYTIFIEVHWGLHVSEQNSNVKFAEGMYTCGLHIVLASEELCSLIILIHQRPV